MSLSNVYTVARSLNSRKSEISCIAADRRHCCRPLTSLAVVVGYSAIVARAHQRLSHGLMLLTLLKMVTPLVLARIMIRDLVSNDINFLRSGGVVQIGESADPRESADRRARGPHHRVR